MFIRIRTINDRQYRYLEERWREGGKVKSRSTYLGPASGGSGGGGGFSILPRRIPDEERGLAYIERLIEKYPGDPFETKAAEMKAAAASAPAVAPVEKATTAPAVDASPAAPDQPSEQSPSAAPGPEKSP